MFTLTAGRGILMVWPEREFRPPGVVPGPPSSKGAQVRTYQRVCLVCGQLHVAGSDNVRLVAADGSTQTAVSCAQTVKVVPLRTVMVGTRVVGQVAA